MAKKICSVCKGFGPFREDRNTCRKCESSARMERKRQVRKELQRISKGLIKGTKAHPTLGSTPPSRRCIMAIGDLHFPFAHRDVLCFLEAIAAKYKPTDVVLLGDEIDAHALSDYTHDPDGHSASTEHKLALEDLHKLYTIFPQAYVCTSNHTVRPFKKAYKAGIPSTFLKSYSEILEAPVGWRWADSWTVDGVRFEHGESFGGQSGAYRAAIHNQCNTAIGHVHAHAGIMYANLPTNQIWSFNVGCLIDEEAYAFKYAQHIKTRPVIGCGIIENKVPHFIPMKMGPDKLWTGEL